jgi:hypothetical protein
LRTKVKRLIKKKKLVSVNVQINRRISVTFKSNSKGLETDIVVKNLGEGLVGSLQVNWVRNSELFAFFDAGWAKIQEFRPN